MALVAPVVKHVPLTTLMVALWLAVSPVLVQLTEYVVVLVRAVVVKVALLPSVVMVPEGAPAPEVNVQEEPASARQVMVVVMPLVTEFEAGVRVTVGGVASATDTVVVADVLPPVPVQVSVYVVVERGETGCVPVKATGPMPSNEQEVLLDVVHERDAPAPLMIEEGAAIKLEITGAGGPTVTLVLIGSEMPPGPLHCMVKVLSAGPVNTAVLKEPLVANMLVLGGAPKTEPAVNWQDTLLLDVQLMLLVAPLATNDGDALSVTVGLTLTMANVLVSLTVSPAVTPTHVMVNDAAPFKGKVVV